MPAKFRFFLLLMLLATAMGLWRLEVESVWHDEAWSIRAIRSPFGTPDDNTPPLYYVTLHGLQKLGAGETPFALRYGSVLINLLATALAFRIGYRWWGMEAGILAGFLMAISPLLWEYAQEVRAYIAVPIIALALLAGGEAFLNHILSQKPIPRRLWAFILIVEIAGLYTHNLVVPVVAWLNTVVIVFMMLRESDPRLPKITKSAIRILFLKWLFAQAMLFLLYIPWLLTQSPSGTPLNTVPEFNFDLLKDIGQAYFFPVAATDLPDSFLTLLTIAGVLAIAAFILAIGRRSLRAFLIGSQAILLPIFSTLLLIRASIDFHPRYYVASVPAALLLMVCVVQIFPRQIKIGIMLAIGFLAALISWQSLHLVADNRRYQHDDFRAMAEYYAQLPADTLIILPFDDEPTLQMYYADHWPIQADFLPLPLYPEPDKALESLQTALAEKKPARVELLTWYQLPADERGMYGCFLGTGEMLETFETYGLSTTGYHLDSLLQAQQVEIPANFQSVLQLYRIRDYASENGLCVQTDWLLNEIPPAEHPEMYSTVTVLLNPFQWEITAENGQILRDDQARVKDWSVGDRGSAFTLLTLPEGVPAGNYDWLIRLYTPENMSGFDVLNANGQSQGKDVRLLPITLPGHPYEKMPESPVLRRDNARDGYLISGQILRVEIENSSNGVVTLQIKGENFALENTLLAESGWLWGELTIPPDASGLADLFLNDVLLASYTVDDVERTFTPPDYGIPVNAAFSDAGNLAGANVSETVLHRDEELRVDLIWQVINTPTVDYATFVQLLDSDGRLLVQSIRPALDGLRPTSSWLADEYLMDSHILNLHGVEYKGQVTLIAGLYNPVSGERVALNEQMDTDYIEIPIMLVIR